MFRAEIIAWISRPGYHGEITVRDITNHRDIILCTTTLLCSHTYGEHFPDAHKHTVIEVTAIQQHF